MVDLHGSDVPLFLVAHSMGGMVALRAALSRPDLFAGMVLNGPLIVPGEAAVLAPGDACRPSPSSLFIGPQVGILDFRVTSARAAVVRTVLGALAWYDPRLILGSVNMDLISRDQEVKAALALDGQRWDKGCKASI
jgi:alpha-beta hydrolase superfamily lysophospholipase